MQVVVDIPDSLAADWQREQQDLPRSVLEAIAAEGYRSGRLSRGQVRQMLGLNFYAGEEWFKKKNLPLNHTVEEFEKDLKTLDELFPRG